MSTRESEDINNENKIKNFDLYNCKINKIVDKNVNTEYLTFIHTNLVKLSKQLSYINGAHKGRIFMISCIHCNIRHTTNDESFMMVLAVSQCDWCNKRNDATYYQMKNRIDGTNYEKAVEGLYRLTLLTEDDIMYYAWYSIEDGECVLM